MRVIGRHRDQRLQVAASGEQGAGRRPDAELLGMLDDEQAGRLDLLGMPDHRREVAGVVGGGSVALQR
jgi:hypothetical protein